MRRASVVVQLEVADRLCASPGSSAYGALSVFARAAFVPKRALVLRRGAFYPQPGVDSAAVLLEPRRDALARETPLFQGLVHAAFEQRRKQLRNAWSKLAFSSERLAAAAERAGIDLARRGETLSVEEFAEMERRLGE
jgi:16S rRNA (adenine1518-N6/adenine1519-N6)-dimethyltransferase